MCFNKEQFTWIFNVIQKARSEDNFELTCKMCPYFGNCNESFCSEVIRQLRLCIINKEG